MENGNQAQLQNPTESQPQLESSQQNVNETGAVVHGQSSLASMQISMVHNSTEEVQQGSAFPLPPEHYLKYSEKNFKILKPYLKYLNQEKVKEEPKEKDLEENSEEKGLESKQKKRKEKKVDLEKLKEVLPPKLPSHTKYKAFNNSYILDDPIPTLPSQNIQQTYTLLPNQTLVQPKQALNHNLLTLIGTLKQMVAKMTDSTQPLPMEAIIKNLETYQISLLNLIDLTNRLRPFQAREKMSQIYAIRLDQITKLLESLKNKLVKSKIVLSDAQFQSGKNDTKWKLELGEEVQLVQVEDLGGKVDRLKVLKERIQGRPKRKKVSPTSDGIGYNPIAALNSRSLSLLPTSSQLQLQTKASLRLKHKREDTLLLDRVDQLVYTYKKKLKNE